MRGELNFVGAVRFGTAALVFDRIGARRFAMELDDIGLAGNAERKAADRHGANDPHPRASFRLAAIDTFVQHAALRGRLIFRP